MSDNICKSKGVVGEAPLIGAGTCHDDGETTIIANKCSYVSSMVAFVMPEKVTLIAKRTFESRTFAHQRKISEGVQKITMIFVGIDARLTCVNNECVPKGDTCDDNEDGIAMAISFVIKLMKSFSVLLKITLNVPAKIIVTVMMI